MPTADEWTMALYKAKRDVLLHLRDQGVKVRLIPPAERARLAKEWLSQHPELFKDDD